MSPRRSTTFLMSAMLAALTLFHAGSPAFSIEIGGAVDRGPLMLQQRADDLRALENRVQRQQFQQQQQQFRDQDRQIIPLQQQRPEVQQFRPSCQIQLLGSNFLSRCR